MRLASLAAALLVVASFGAGIARADEGCPAGNLLAGRAPLRSVAVRGELARLTDGAVAEEGSFWKGSAAVVLENGDAVVEWDLGAPVVLRGAYLQADANDAYTLEASLDGRDWRAIARFDPVVEALGPGLRGRAGPLPGLLARYVRIGAPIGDLAYSISEFQVFCQAGPAFPRDLRVEPSLETPGRFAWVGAVWNERTSLRWQLSLAVLGLVLVGRVRTWSKRACQALAVLAIATYVNLFAFHFDGYVHLWDVCHYYLGAKYFPELGYERLYECIAVADAEDGLRGWVERRTMTDLARNVVVPTTDILAGPDRCTSHFSTDRWAAFRTDVAFFRHRSTKERWEQLQIDHGFNGSPAWMILGRPLASLAPASEGFLRALALVDPAFEIGAVLVAAWAFGWQTTAIALLVFATSFPSRFFWTGGAFLRADWLFFLVAAVAFAKRQRPALAGAALAYAATLRIFPVLALLGPGLLAIWRTKEQRSPDRETLRFFAGFAAAAVLLLAISLPIVGGVDALRDFRRNLAKHGATPLTNNMGLPMVVSYRPSTVGRRVVDSSINPWKPWIDARHRGFDEARGAYWAVLVGYLGLLALAVRGRPLWFAIALAITAFGFFVDLSSYYYVFLLPLALLAGERLAVARILLACTAATHVIAWAPLEGMPTWWDEQFVAMAAVMLVGFAAIVAGFAFPSRQATAQAASRS